MMCRGVSKSGSPISKWTTSFPVASKVRALTSTSNAVSVPSRDIRSANRMVFNSLLDTSLNFKGFVWVPYYSDVERLKRPSFFFRREVLQFLPYTRAIIHEGLCLDLGLLNEALLSVQSGKFLLGTGA